MLTRRVLPAALALVVGAILVGEVLAAQNASTKRVSVNSHGTQGNGDSLIGSTSANGRFVAFESSASNLAGGDTNRELDIFVRDRKTHDTRRVSVDSHGAQGNGPSSLPTISASGRSVAFQSYASNLVGADTNGTLDIFVRNRQTHNTKRLSLDSHGAQGNGANYSPSISADGRFVAFVSDASNLVGADTNGTSDVFVRDRQTGTTRRVSVNSHGAQGNGESGAHGGPSISGDGRFVAFDSFASNLVGGDTNGALDVFVRDRQTHTTSRVSVDSHGVQGDFDSFSPSISAGAQGNSGSFSPSIFAGGRFVAFLSSATNLVGGDMNGSVEVFVRDRQTHKTRRVSVDSHGVPGYSDSSSPSISADGRFVAFVSDASNLVGADTNGTLDIFVRDRQSGKTRRVSVGSHGAQGNGESDRAAISADGRFVTFESSASNLAGGDTNRASDVFVHGPLHP